MLLSRQNVEIQQKNEEIMTQRDEIASQRDMVTWQKEEIEVIHEELTSSIRYALTIQQAMLPSTDFLNEAGLSYFTLFKPRDIVSGDFYWATCSSRTIIIAVADCTGHGVPGAFMSMLGITLLNEIIVNEHITQPDIILNRLRADVMIALQQGSGSQRDGMDIALCALNLDTLELQFAGANNPLYIIKPAISHWPPDSYRETVGQGGAEANGQQPAANSQLIELKGDKMPIGIHDLMDRFTLHTQSLQKNDCIYLFSDGIADQFGGPQNKKFMMKNLKSLFCEISSYSVNDQKDILEKTTIEWKGDNAQVDDITVMGIRI
jgi:serine phosphatase RsbU (regulator of sigma subunit)